MGAAEDDAAAYELFERIRWGGAAPPCPHCGAGDCYYLRPRDGLTRATRTGAPSARRVWRCRSCRRQFSVLTGTVLAGSRVPVRVLAAVLTGWAAGGRPRGRDVAAGHGLTAEAARHLLRRVDAALAAASESAGSADPFAAVFAAPGGDELQRRLPARRRPGRQVGPSADHGAG